MKTNQRKTTLRLCSVSTAFILYIMLTPLLFLGEGMGVRCVANNLTLGNTITIASANQISFTVKWDNSWYVSAPPANWDAVWLFVKYKDCSTTDWKHAKLSTTGTDHTVTGGKSLLNIEMPAVNDGNGVFVRRKATGTGNIDSLETVTLKLSGITTGTYNFKVFGIEMVKVLQDSFYLGDGSSPYTYNSIYITSENAVSPGGATSVALPAAYPKGYNAFYCMKYEITQEQYVDFLNTLTYTQQATRTIIAPNSMPNVAALSAIRNGIKLSVQGLATTTPAAYACDLSGNNVYNEADDGQNLACNGISWADLTAYLDWACLRPMTGLEFEKVCRGPIKSNAGEYAWGNTQVTYIQSNGGISNAGTGNEKAINPGDGTCAAGTVYGGPLRVGFAATATTNRLKAGASYYGALDMSGNVYERVVGTGSTCSAYTGTLGDGTLDTNTGWPSSGIGLRGGCFNDASNRITVSNRDLDAYYSDDGTRNQRNGGRGVR